MQTTNEFPSRFFSEHRSGGNFGALPQKPKGARRNHARASLVKNGKITVLESTAEQGVLKQSGSVKAFAQQCQCESLL